MEEEPLFCFGVCSDLQYADINNGQSYHGSSRYYRNALVLLREVLQN